MICRTLHRLRFARLYPGQQRSPLRNPDTAPQTLNTTLRQVFDIPAYVTSAVTLRSSFADQLIGEGGLQGLAIGELIDIDKNINITMPKSSVFVLEGVCK